MRTTTRILMVCLLALGAGAAVAQTPDGIPPAFEDECDNFSGAAFGLCNAYCEAMDCHLANDGDPATNPSASATACARVGSKFMNFAGVEPPCDTRVGCPCVEPDETGVSWSSGLWTTLAGGELVAGCISDPAIEITDLGFEGGPAAAGVLNGKCTISSANGSTEFPADPEVLTADEAEACAGLLLLVADGLSDCP